MKLESTNLMIWGGILFAVVMAVAQEANKEWTIHRTGDADTLQFTVRRIRPGSHWSSTDNVPRSRFQGLSLDTLEHGGPAKFRYVADAGTLECTGRFSWTGGSGDYTFVPSPAFGSALRDMGYATPDQDEQLTMLLTGITLDFARGVKDARLGASTSDLIRLRSHGVTLAYVDGVRRAGYTSLLAPDIVDLRDHGVTVSFLQDLKDAGYNLSAQEAIDLRDHGVDSDFVRKLRSYGLRPAAAELTELRDHGVTPEYLAGMKDAGYGSLSAGDLVQLRDHGVETAFVREARGCGYNFTPGELVELRDHGVDGAYLRTLRDAGMRNLSAEQIAKLKMHGVD